MKVIYPGTFDPITNGHLDVIIRSTQLFEKVVIGIANNPNKKTMFTLEQRVNMVKVACVGVNNIEIIGFSCMLADLIAEHNINLIIRGVRAVSDFEYELQLSYLNKLLTNGIESIFLPPSSHLSYVSSTIIRDIIIHGGDISKLVPSSVLEQIAQHS